MRKSKYPSEGINPDFYVTFYGEIKKRLESLINVMDQHRSIHPSKSSDWSRFYLQRSLEYWRKIDRPIKVRDANRVMEY